MNIFNFNINSFSPHCTKKVRLPGSTMRRRELSTAAIQSYGEDVFLELCGAV
jgi:hypothetical protein